MTHKYITERTIQLAADYIKQHVSVQRYSEDNGFSIEQGKELFQLAGIYLQDIEDSKPKNNPRKFHPKKCIVCGEVFDSSYGKTYCSDRCRDEAARKREREKYTKKEPIEKQCSICGKTFTTKHYSKIYCSVFCKRVAISRREKSNRDKINNFLKNTQKTTVKNS